RRHTRFSRDWSSDVCSSDLEITGYQHEVLRSWSSMADTLVLASNDDNNKSQVIVIETYPGVNDSELVSNIKNKFQPDAFFHVADYYKSEDEINEIAYPDVTDDRIFGYMTRLTIEAFFDDHKLSDLRSELSKT